jgi:hypothetical protein
LITAQHIVRRLLSLNPDLTYREIGELAGVSKQRVFQLVEQHGLKKNNRWADTSKACMGGCSKRLRPKTNKTGWCRECLKKAHSYEFVCGFCRQVNVVTGSDAASRRQNAKRRKFPGVQFCTKRCSGLYFQRRKRQAEKITSFIDFNNNSEE